MSDPQVPATPSPRPSQRRWAVAALAVGIASLVLCLIPWLGLILGIAGVVLGIIAVRTAVSKGVAITGLGFGIAGIAAGVAVLLFVYLALPAIGTWAQRQGLDDGATENSRYDDYDASKDYLVSTPCYSFTGPEGWINHQPTYATKDCQTNLESWGDLQPDGTVTFDRLGDVYGYVTVRAAFTADSITHTGTAIRLDGADADLVETSGTNTSPSHDNITATKTEIMVELPHPEKNYDGTFSVLFIEIAASDDQVQDVVHRLVDTWKWN